MAPRPTGQTGTTNKQTFLRIAPRSDAGVPLPANTKVIVQKTHDRLPFYGCLVRGVNTRHGHGQTKRGWIHKDDVTLDAVPAATPPAAATDTQLESLEETAE